MSQSALMFSLILLGTTTLSTFARGQGTVVVAVPARAGAVEGKTENSDAFIWQIFTEFAAPVSQDNSSLVVFETWASDADTFSAKPHWPKPGEPMKFQASVLGLVKMFNAIPSPAGLLALKIDVKCEEPPGAAVGGFPTAGTPPPCIAEQVARNRAQFDYIVNNGLNTKSGYMIGTPLAREPLKRCF
jgi:hypothetical protein